MNRLIKTLLTICLLGVSSLEGTPNFIYIEHTLKEKTLKDYCLEISRRLDALGYISVSPEKFATFIYKVALCESGHRVNAKGKDSAGSLGLWQMSKDTRRKLKVRHGCMKMQSENYFKFLRAGGKKLRWIKNSIDLHCYNFTPANFQKDTLSQVTNAGLKALDFNKDSVITKEDIRLFQKKRIKA